MRKECIAMAQTPMMRQYHNIKAQYPGMILLYRMGDFYEVFFDDAKICSRVLGLTLTSRSKGENAIPMAGVPHHSIHGYVKRLIQAGHKVAVCDQIEDPREAKGLVARDVTRVITPGTLTEDALLDSKDHNYLVALITKGDDAGMAWVDLSTGQFMVEDMPVQKIPDELARLNPSELLVAESDASRDGFSDRLRRDTGAMITARPDWTFGRDAAKRTVLDHFGVASLAGFGCENLGPALAAAGAILNYLQETQKISLGHIRTMGLSHTNERVVLDRATQMSLELARTMRGGEKRGTLLWVLDRTLTPMGGRTLKEWVISPLRSRDAILARQDGIGELMESRGLRADVRGFFDQVYDIERLTSRVATGRANARDLLALGRSLDPLPSLKTRLAEARCEKLAALGENIDPVEEVRIIVAAAIAPEPPVQVKEGGLIRDGYSAELDELRSIQRDGKSWMANFQAREVERTGISTLKVGYNKVFGYYLEITHVNQEKVPADYVRKQTLKNAERYITSELKEYETRVLTADERARDLEYDIFVQTRQAIAEHTARLQETAARLAELDCLAGLAELAADQRYVRPMITDDRELIIEEGRHPVIERASDEPFVPNCTNLDGDKNLMMIITGPNMAGKSTYIRQVAIITLMAHMGSFVPAASARIGLVDRIFTRVGAADELSRGQSTFMVEMVETANILNNATDRSLIILDEVGRGTSTFDGVSIAWAVAEYIVQRNKSRTLFATHYHELTELSTLFSTIKNHNIAVKEWQDEIIFLRRIVEGGTDKSYGIHVARLAGVPQDAVERAKTILGNLESATLDDEDRPRFAITGKRKRKGMGMQLTIFSSESDMISQTIQEIDVANITPIEAIQKLQELQELAERHGPKKGKRKKRK
jgi:DNA mismatch repair protein MutS